MYFDVDIIIMTLQVFCPLASNAGLVYKMNEVTFSYFSAAFWKAVRL